MLGECMDGLNIKSGSIIFDGTLGLANHSKKILQLSSPNGRLIATDLDEQAIKIAKENLKEFEGRYQIFNQNFKDFEEILDKLSIDKIDGVLLDLGMSSLQIDDSERGFSYMSGESGLDMRMGKSVKQTAEDIVNNYSEKELIYILKTYGEENFAKKIAENIVLYRKDRRIETVSQLVEITDKSIPDKFASGHKAKKTFQALRICLNEELTGLYECVSGMIRRLKTGGRICVISFHSLEDRIVKNVFNEFYSECVCSKKLPVCICGKKREINIITHKPLTATDEEIKFNPRSKSAKLRIAEKI